MTWIIPALVAGAVLLLIGSEKKGTAAPLSVRPRKGEVWTWVVQTSRPFTADDWQVMIQILKGTAELMGVTRAGSNRYVITLRYLQDGHRTPINEKTNLGGDDWMVVNSAVRAPISAEFNA